MNMREIIDLIAGVALSEALEPHPSVYKSFVFSEDLRGNFRFMFNARRREMIIGYKNPPVDGSENGSHGGEFAQAGAKGKFDDWFPRGWVGIGGRYRNGVIHFAPAMSKDVLKHVSAFDNTMACLAFFQKNGAGPKCLVRGFGDVWEQPLGDILDQSPK